MDIFQRISRLNLPDKLYIVIGSGILEIKGIRTAGDLDIMTTQAVFDDLKKQAEWKHIKKTGKQGDIMELLEKDKVQIYYHMYGKFQFSHFMQHLHLVEICQGIYFANLSDLLRVKKEWNRTKDQDDIVLIEKYLTIIL